MSPRSASEWTCEDCGVTVSRIDGAKVGLPESWERSSDGQYCLLCRRRRAGEAAQEALAGDSSVEDRAKARRSGLIEFEVRRTPESPDRTIARACRTSAAAVAAARRRLQEDAAPEPVGK